MNPELERLREIARLADTFETAVMGSPRRQYAHHAHALRLALDRYFEDAAPGLLTTSGLTVEASGEGNEPGTGAATTQPATVSVAPKNDSMTTSQSEGV